MIFYVMFVVEIYTILRLQESENILTILFTISSIIYVCCVCVVHAHVLRECVHIIICTLHIHCMYAHMYVCHSLCCDVLCSMYQTV